ncbi:MAG: alkaline phosphatase family protein [Roseivirga sp.]|nr:alkaline phosphatase family protein [Roseivirga sp.]
MKNTWIFLLVILFGCGTSHNQEKPKKAIFIILDGIPADVLEKVSTPFLDEIAAVGGYTRAYQGGKKDTYNETPTISAPGYMNLITGTWANKHNVVNNYNQSPNYHYYNIFRIAKEVKPELHTALFSSWLDNRTVLVGEGSADGGGKLIDYAFDGLEKDLETYPKTADRFEKIDNRVAKETADYITAKAPDLSWVYLEYTDDVAHAKGDSEAFYETVRLADRQVGQIWHAIKERQKQGEEWMLVVTTDHGRDAETGMSHGGQSERERTTWITTNHTALNSRFTEGEPAVVDILPSVLGFIGVDIPSEISRELDGVSFVGEVHAADLRASVSGTDLVLLWKPIGDSGKAKIYVSFTNEYKVGGDDRYEKLVAGIELKTGEVTLRLSKRQQTEWRKMKFLKVVLETPTNKLNYWVTDQ